MYNWFHFRLIHQAPIKKMPRQKSPDPAAAALAFRSAAVARMANMPVATLRIWEQRYGAVRPITAPTGYRMYSPSDVQRVLLLRQLTMQGHAIGSSATFVDSSGVRQTSQNP